MRNFALPFAIASSSVPSFGKAPGTSGAEMQEPPAIVFAAFGTSRPKAAAVFDHIDSAAKARYPGHAVHWAFTSGRIVREIRERGGRAKTLPEAIDELARSGVTSAVFQSLHVVPGQMDAELRGTDTGGLCAAYGAPLLGSEADIDRVILALGPSIRPDVPNVVVCHGNSRYPEYNRRLIELAGKLRSRHGNAYVCSVEGEPGTERLREAIPAARDAGAVHFIPLMIVAGVHIMDDVMGDGPDSWKSIIGAPEATVSKPLGYNDAIFEIYFSHLDDALESLETAAATAR